MRKTMNMKLALSLVLALVLMMSVFALGAFAEAEAVEADGDAAVGEEEGTETSSENSEKKMVFEPMNFVTNLKYMGTGMLGIFIVIGVIIISVVVLNKATSPKKKTEVSEE